MEKRGLNQINKGYQVWFFFKSTIELIRCYSTVKQLRESSDVKAISNKQIKERK